MLKRSAFVSLLFLSGCVSAPVKPDLAQAVLPTEVRRLKLRLVSIQESSAIGEMTDRIKAGVEAAFAEAGMALAKDAAGADGDIFMKIDGARTSTLDPFRTSLVLRGPDGQVVEQAELVGGAIGNKLNSRTKNWNRIAHGISYNLVFKILNSRHVADFARRKDKVTTATGGGLDKAEMKRLMLDTLREAGAPAAAKPAEEYKSDVDVPAYKVSPKEDAFAVVVGVEKYNALPEARFAERDAKAVAAHLVAMGYPQRNIVLLTGAAATRTGVAKHLEAWLPNNVSERSTVFFYFSGHGAPDAKTSQAFLVPTDGDPQYLEETAYPMSRLYERLGALKAKRVVVALDSCFSGAGGRSVLAQGTRPLVTKLSLQPAAGKILSLTASSSEEITGALEEQGHGLFTYHFLKALSETAGRGTVAEVYDALKPRVQDEARRQNRGQTPQLFGAGASSAF